MRRLFDLKTGKIAIGDPTMGLVQYSLKLVPGTYFLEESSLRIAPKKPVAGKPFIVLDTPGIFVMDASHLEAFTTWYHGVGNECLYMLITIIERLPDLESALGSSIAFYWEEELSGICMEGTYTLDPSKIARSSRTKQPKSSKATQPAKNKRKGETSKSQRERRRRKR